MGPVGSAWATFLARALALALLVRVLWRGRNGVSIRGRAGWLPDLRVAADVLRIGVPAALEQLVGSAAFLTLTVIVARLGTETLAAHRIGITALSFSFLPGIGFAIAATTLVGQSVGAHRIEEGAAAARIAAWWAVLWMGLIGLILFVFATPTMDYFSDDPGVIHIGASALRAIALAQPIWAVGIVMSGAIRGTGNTRYPLLIGSLGMWASVLLAYVILETFGGGLAGAWITFCFTSPITSTLTWLRFKRTVKERRVLEAAGPAPAPA